MATTRIYTWEDAIEYGCVEMQCHCEHCKCEEYIDYMHHDDWSFPEDWACNKCVKDCYKEEDL